MFQKKKWDNLQIFRFFHLEPNLVNDVCDLGSNTSQVRPSNSHCHLRRSRHHHLRLPRHCQLRRGVSLSHQRLISGHSQVPAGCLGGEGRGTLTAVRRSNHGGRTGARAEPIPEHMGGAEPVES